MSDLKYPASAKWLHWSIGIIVIVMLIAGRTLEALPVDEREQMIMVHSGLGTLVLLLMLVRWTWRMSHEPPAPTANMPAWQIRLARLMHWSFYVLLVLQPILGILQAMYITDYSVKAFGVIDYSAFAAGDAENARLFHVLHGLNATILSVLVIGHVLAGLYHHFAQKDAVLKRMLPFGNVS